MYAPAPITSRMSSPSSRPAPRSSSSADSSRSPRPAVLLAQVDEPLGRLRDAHRDQHPLEHQVRPPLHHVAVLDRPGLALVGVHDHVPRPRLRADGLPLDAGRESGAAVAGQARRLQLGDDRARLRQRAQHLEAAARLRSRRATRPPARARSTARRSSWERASGLDPVAAQQHRGELAVAEALDAEHRDAVRVFALPREEVLRAHAVADRPDADAHRVRRHLEERVERDDLVHLAAADVHPVGDRVRELGRDRPDLAPDEARGCRAGSCARSAGARGAWSGPTRPRRRLWKIGAGASDYPRAMRDELTDLASRLVAIDSVNPDLVPGGAGEGEIARFVAAWCEDHGLETSVEEIAPGRWNVVAVARGSGGGKTLMLNAHMDTVGYAGMDRGARAPRRGRPALRPRRLRHEVEPRRAPPGRRAGEGARAARRRRADRGRRRGGREHRHCGRGGVAPGRRCDRDGADRGARRARAPRVRLARGRDDRSGGARLAARPRDRRDRQDGPRPRRARGARSRAPCRRRRTISSAAGRSTRRSSRAASSSRPIPTVACSRPSAEPIPGESAEAVAAEVQAIVDRAAASDPDFRAEVRTTFVREPFEVDRDEAVVQSVLGHAAATLGREAEVVGVPFWADAAILSAAGNPDGRLRAGRRRRSRGRRVGRPRVGRALRGDIPRGRGRALRLTEDVRFAA